MLHVFVAEHQLGGQRYLRVRRQRGIFGLEFDRFERSSVFAQRIVAFCLTHELHGVVLDLHQLDRIGQCRRKVHRIICFEAFERGDGLFAPHVDVRFFEVVFEILDILRHDEAAHLDGQVVRRFLHIVGSAFALDVVVRRLFEPVVRLVDSLNRQHEHDRYDGRQDDQKCAEHTDAEAMWVATAFGFRSFGVVFYAFYHVKF